jgi:hypothetical protein
MRSTRTPVEEVLAMHRRYEQERVSMQVLADERGCSRAWIAQLFAANDLPVRSGNRKCPPGCACKRHSAEFSERVSVTQKRRWAKLQA